jgi:hypothetical protein
MDGGLSLLDRAKDLLFELLWSGLLLRTRLNGPDGEILCDGVHNATCETCRVLMSRGIVGAFETRKAGIP